MAYRYTDRLTLPVKVGIKTGFLNGVTVGATNFAFMGAYALALWYGGLRIRDGAYNGEMAVPWVFHVR